VAELRKHALDYAAQETERSIRNLLGRTVSSEQCRRIAERTIRGYNFAMAGKSGSRVGHTTNIIGMLKVGESVEVEASSKANLHGSIKTLRRLTSNPELKFRFEQIEPFIWRIERRPDGAYNLNKAPERNAKAVFIASVPLGGTKRYTGLRKTNQILNDFTKNKARLILNDLTANWKGKRYSRGIEIRRVK
jgi:hypothetical protein